LAFILKALRKPAFKTLMLLPPKDRYSPKPWTQALPDR
jgi:hypothetical protein